MSFFQLFGLGARDDTGKAFASVNNNLNRTTNNAKKLNGNLRIMRGGMGQLGHQIQDVAVQLQMGQNALMVFTQQGSQVASLFGPTGAIIGALGAVGGAVAMALVPDLMNAKDKVQELENATRDLSDLFRKDASTGAILFAGKLKEVAAVSEAGAENMMQMASGEAIRRQKELRQELDELAQSVLTLGQAGAGQQGMTQEGLAASILGITTEQYQELSENVRLLGTEQGMTNEEFASYLNNLRQSKKAGQEQKNELDKLTDAFNANNTELAILNKELTQFSEAEYQEDVDQVGTSFEALKNKIERSFDRIQKLTPSQVLAKELEKSKNLTFEQKRALAELIAELSALEYQEMFSARAAADTAREQKNAAKETKERAKQTKFAYDILRMFRDFDEAIKADEQLIRDKNKKTIEGMRQSFMSEIDLLAAQEAEKRALLESFQDDEFTAEFTRQDALTQLEQHFADKRTDIYQKEQEQKRQIQLAGMEVVKDSLSFMASNLKEGTALQKTAFLATKAFAASEAIVSAELAAAKMLARDVGIFGLGAIASANIVRGFGYASAANIMAQAVASFDGGGFTGRGARSGGLDGRGGFMAMLHPNETVVDHTKGGSGVTIVNNIDATGGGPDVDIKIRRAVEMGNQQTVHVIRDLAARGRLV